jgi:glutathione S-transferase
MVEKNRAPFYAVSMLALYSRANSGSAAVEALLTILDIPFELIDVPRTADRSMPKWFYELNPLGQVPVLKLLDGKLMTESAAMMIYLADLHPAAGLAPAIASPQRADYLRAMIFMAAAPYATDLRLYYPDRYSTDPSHAPAIKVKASADLNRV